MKPDPDDVFLWPDGTFCDRSEYWMDEYGWKSDDFIVIRAGSPEWIKFCEESD